MKHEYLTLNGKVVYEKIGEGSSAKIMIFSNDALGRPFAVKYSKNNGTKFTNYFYALNQQGDVVKIFRPVAVTDATGNTTGYTEKTYATYTYDAWGKLIGITNSAGTSIINKQTTSTSLANLNPLRYRGYYYDNETGFYYLQSRYYDPVNHRFINADIYSSTGQGFVGTNMFAYCLNNPINCIDSEGTISIWVYLALNKNYGFIHLCVQQHICATNPGIIGYERGVYNADDKLLGRVDLYEIATGKSWEVKSARSQAAAYPQLSQYLGNQLKNKKLLIEGEAGRFTGTFVINCLNSSYLVSYITPEAGVVTYTVKEIKYQEQYDYAYEPVKVPVRNPHPAPSPLRVSNGYELGPQVGFNALCALGGCVCGIASAFARPSAQKR